MRLIQSDDIRQWVAQSPDLAQYVHSIGEKQADAEYVNQELGVPYHLQFTIAKLAEERMGEPVPKAALDSIPFYSLCKGLFVPLSGLVPERAGGLFGIPTGEAPDTATREKLLLDFIQKNVGLDLAQKLGCVLGDPFLGKPSTFRRDSLLRLLMSVSLKSRRELLDRLTVVGDVSVLFAELRPEIREEPALTAAEVLQALRLMPLERNKANRYEILRSLLVRCGKMEAYFLAKLLLRKAGFGFDYQGPLIARILAGHFSIDEGHVSQAIGLTDVFHVARVLTEEGPDALRKIQMQPLVPIRPALAGGTTEEIKAFPVFVERKYDGIRLMLHKSTDSRGSMLCGAYTRNRHDWLELVAGLDQTIRTLPCRNCILDGELFGTVIDLEGARPASVYEVYAALQGEKGSMPVNLKFAAFDLVYIDNQDITRFPLSQRRQRMQMLVGPLLGMPLAPSMTISEGQIATSKEDVNRLYGHFRAQGYEGIIAKEPEGQYALGARDPNWRKRKPEITLDLVLLGAVLAVTSKEHAGRFGSYVIGARTPEGGWHDAGDVAGLDKLRDQEIQGEIMRAGLLTGRRIERPSSSGVRPGFELRPEIVVTVRFEGVVRETGSGKLSLRDPKLVVIRSDKSPSEADSIKAIEELYLRQRVG